MVSFCEVSTSVQSHALSSPQLLGSSQRCEQRESFTPCPRETHRPDAHSALFVHRSASLAVPRSLSGSLSGSLSPLGSSSSPFGSSPLPGSFSELLSSHPPSMKAVHRASSHIHVLFIVRSLCSQRPNNRYLVSFHTGVRRRIAAGLDAQDGNCVRVLRAKHPPIVDHSVIFRVC